LKKENELMELKWNNGKVVNNLNSCRVQNDAFHLSETQANPVATHGPTHAYKQLNACRTRRHGSNNFLETKF
jgi:hypothetical protein